MGFEKKAHDYAAMLCNKFVSASSDLRYTNTGCNRFVSTIDIRTIYVSINIILLAMLWMECYRQ